MRPTQLCKLTPTTILLHALQHAHSSIWRIPPLPITQAHIYTYTHIYTHTFVHMLSHTYMYTGSYTCTQVHKTHSNIRTKVHVLTYWHEHAHIHYSLCMYVFPCTHSDAFLYILLLTHVCTNYNFRHSATPWIVKYWRCWLLLICSNWISLWGKHLIKFHFWVHCLIPQRGAKV